MNKLNELSVTQTFQNVSFYTLGGLGINRVDAKTLTVEVKPFGQYPEALAIKWLEKGKRKPVGRWIAGHVFFVVLSAAEAISPDESFIPMEDSVSGMKCSKSRYPSCDSRWESDFLTKLEAANVNPLVLLHERQY